MPVTSARERSMRYEGRHFSNQRVSLDGHQFEGCRFTNVLFEYSGGPIYLCGCQFEGFGWQFGGDLARGLAVLGQLHATSPAMALGFLSQAMFPANAASAASTPHPSLAAVLAAEARESAGARTNVEALDYSRLKKAIKRGRPLPRAA
jgi:hypothetical protein